jgi:hypothetical protein
VHPLYLTIKFFSLKKIFLYSFKLDNSIDYQALYEGMKKKALMALKLLKKLTSSERHSEESEQIAKMEREHKQSA